MTRADLARMLDHSVLKPESTASDIRAGAEVVRAWRVGYFCVQPYWVKLAIGLLADADARVVSVIAFPHGVDVATTKARAAAAAVADGAREIDMVLNLGALKSGDTETTKADIAAVVRAVPGATVKVIIEAAALSSAEKLLACRLAIDAGAAFVKTSTGFHPAGGATLADVRLMRGAVGPAVGVKASGGIRTLADARAMLDAGANRLGTSSSAAILAALD